MIIQTLCWIANFILIAGQLAIGNKHKWGFLLVALGEFIWIAASIALWQPAMIFICVIFGSLAIRNYYEWTRKKEHKGWVLTRNEILHDLKMYYLSELYEDPIDGTTFDMDVLDSIETLERKYSK